ncbi:MAG: histidine phosphatase family protein [Bacteroidota bacterium]
MKIYYLRHTDADDDRRDSYGGVCDDPLVDDGRAYASKVANFLSGKNIGAIFTSPYLRAKETGEIIQKVISCPLVEVYNLRERNSYGVLSGIEQSRAKTLFPEIHLRILQMKKDGTKPSKSPETLPGAEIYLDLLLRASDAIRLVLREATLMKVDTVAVVTHGGFSWALFKDVLNQTVDLEKGEVVVLNGNTLDDLTIDKAETEAIKKEL